MILQALLEADFPVEIQSIQIAEQIDAVALIFICLNDVFDKFSRKALMSMGFAGHDRSDLDIVFFCPILHKTHPVCGGVGQYFSILHKGIGDVIALKISILHPGFKIESINLLRQRIQPMPQAAVPHIIMNQFHLRHTFLQRSCM